MVGPVPSSNVQSFATPQPNFAAGNETRVDTERTQPRNAPAADTQRNERRELSARDDENRRVEAREQRRSEEERAQPPPSEGRRGSNVDVTV